MGKKGSWFSAIKRAFTHNSKNKPSDVPNISFPQVYNKKSSNEKKKGNAISRHGESKSFIPPLFREPSSIEKILGEADQLHIRPPTAASSDHEPKTTSTLPQRQPSVVIRNRKEISYVRRPEPTFRHRHLSATKIQSAYRGYQARRNFRSLRGLVRLQGMIRSENAKRQTINAMKQMQLLVRVQTQIQSRRIQMLENQTLYQQGYVDEKETESVLRKWTTSNRAPQVELNEDWDDSLLTKEEIEARSLKKMEAATKRERAMAYAYFHRESPQTPLENQTDAFPWWCNWLERQQPQTNSPQIRPTTKTPSSTPPQHKASSSHTKQKSLTLTKTQEPPVRTKHFQTTPTRKPRGVNFNHSPYNGFPLRDDDSLTSCPPFSVPNYMTPTKSAKAKARASSNPKERLQGSIATPVNDSKRRFSFSFTWNTNKGSSKKESTSQKVVLEKNRYPCSVGDLSVDSAVSMPAVVGRKPFNRFV